MRTLLAALLCLAAACAAPVDQTQVAIDAFEAVHGPVSAYCKERAAALIFDTAPSSRMPALCGRQAAACLDEYDADSAHAWISEDTGEHAIAHETLHLLFRCMDTAPNGDHNHSDKAWAEPGMYI